MTHVDLPTINVLELCAGVGMLGRGFSEGCERAGLGRARTVCHVEREAYAAAVLAARMAEGQLPDAPIWSDLTTFYGRPWHGIVDAVIAGLPCQPYSVAGARKGHEDERAIWPGAFDIIDQVRPALVFLENVPGQLKFFQPIGERLCGMGFRFEAGLFSAEEVGASHKRERFFVLAVANGELHNWTRNRGAGRRREFTDDDDDMGTLSGQLENSPRDDGAGGERGLRMRRGVCEAGNAMEITKREGSPSKRIGESDQEYSIDPADTATSRRRRGAQQHNGGSPLQGSRPDQCSTELANTSTNGRGEAGRQESGSGSGQLGRGDEVMGDADHAGSRAGSARSREIRNGRNGDIGSAVAESGISMGVGQADSQRQRPQGIIEAGTETRPTGRSSRATLPRFAPGPNDPRWPAIIDAYPELAPFLVVDGPTPEEQEAQPALRRLADGLASGLANRVDQLRCVGNGVAPDSASIAFVKLWNRITASGS